jgi:hypothetical protein
LRGFILSRSERFESVDKIRPALQRDVHSRGGPSRHPCVQWDHLYCLLIGSPLAQRLVSLFGVSGSGNGGGFSCRQIEEHFPLLA